MPGFLDRKIYQFVLYFYCFVIQTPASSTHWDAYAATFSQPSAAATSDNNEDPQAKFRRLMGMKSESKALNQDITQRSSEIINKQNKLLADLDQQYEESRFLTHRARGVGFGFGGAISSNLSKTQDVVNEKGPEDKQAITKFNMHTLQLYY